MKRILKKKFKKNRVDIREFPEVHPEEKPLGRPKKENAWADTYNELLNAKHALCDVWIDGRRKILEIKSNKTFRYMLGLSLIKEGLKGNVPAVRELADRTVGKPTQEVETNTPVTYIISDEFLPEK